MRVFFAFVILSLFAVACNRSDATSKDVIVTVGDKALTKGEIQTMFAADMPQEDSIILAEHYIHTWIRDALLYRVAIKNISNSVEIDRLVENYRKSLVIYQYQDRLVNEKVLRDIREDELLQYYEENKAKFLADRPFFKGLFIKVPIDAPQLNEIREWYKSSKSSALENLDKYSVRNAVVYDNFFDRWVSQNEIEDHLPDEVKSDLLKGRQVELRDSDFCYFLTISDRLNPGDPVPFEYIKNTIKEFLINQRKLDFLQQMENSLYEAALKKGEIKFKK